MQSRLPQPTSDGLHCEKLIETENTGRLLPVSSLVLAMLLWASYFVGSLFFLPFLTQAGYRNPKYPASLCPILSNKSEST